MHFISFQTIEEQSDQGLLCLSFCLYLLKAFYAQLPLCLIFRVVKTFV